MNPTWRAGPILLLALLLIGLSYIPSPLAGATSASSSQAPSLASSLSISAVPPALPVGGGSYPALVVSLEGPGGAPSIAVNATVVSLVSRQPSVGAVSPQVTIEPGRSFAVANFTTTSSPGADTVYAAAAGLNSSSVTVTTVTPGGVASQLAVIPVPGSLLAGSSGGGVVIVEALDAQGLPARPTAEVAVSLASSDPATLTLPFPSLTLAAGSFLASTYYEVGLSPGVTSIQATSQVLGSASAQVDVAGDAPTAIAIFAQPDPLPTSTTGRLLVALTDLQGQPVPAPSAVTVAISSSNTSLVATGQTATISPGQIFAVDSLSSGPATGTADLAASAPGLASAFQAVQVVAPAQPTSLELTVAPGPVPADAGSYGSVFVAVTDAAGDPAVTSSGVTVTLSSSNSTVGQVAGTVTIPPGGGFAVAAFTATYTPGDTSITALAQNFRPATASAQTYGAAPAELLVEPLLAPVPADGGNYSAVEVALEGPSGVPAVAPSATVVQLASGDPGVASVTPRVTIPAGQGYAVAYVTSRSPGNASISASALGLTASARLATSRLPPSQLGVYVAPSNGTVGLSGPDALIAVQVQGPGGYPATALADTAVSVSSSNTSVVQPFDLQVPAGSDYAWALLNSSGAGRSSLAASAQGLEAGSATLSEAPLPVELSLSSSPGLVSVGQTAVLTLDVRVLGVPVPGAAVTLSTTAGTLGAAQGVTDSQGGFSATFSSSQAGVAIVTATVESPLLGSQSATTTVAVGRATGPGGGLGLVGTLVPVLVVVAVVAAAALFIRRTIRRRTREAEGGSSEAYGDEAPSP
ncbi:MAG: Ig-like domain-containing protein [Nitrososphaerota archaeon]|nr:Ig-like domain-containing protein [Nitrososphaerota archaeon]